MANDDAGSARTAHANPNSAAQSESLLLDDAAIRRALLRIAHEIVEKNDDLSRLYLVGIPNGGVPLAKQLAANLREIASIEALIGVLDTTLYRDDLVSSGARPRLRRTEMPSSVDDRVVILVDDVASTGRTIRAAMDALMDFGRPRGVQVAALVDRGHRELPIKIDYAGKNVPTQRGDRVAMRGPDEALEVVLLRQASAQAGPRAASAGEPRAQRAGKPEARSEGQARAESHGKPETRSEGQARAELHGSERGSKEPGGAAR